MKLTTALAFAVGGASARTLWTDLKALDYENGYSYAQWKSEFGHLNSFHEGSEAAFKANLRMIREHNENPANTWKMGVNPFTGLTRSEFKSKVLGGYKKPANSWAEVTRKSALTADLSTHVPVSELPASIDWRTKNVVTPVKDQGMCGGCWSFSSAETSESAVAMATGKLFTFSEQQILSCSENPLQCGGTGGCSGATQEIGFNYSASAGLTLEKDYPYQGVTGTCDASKVKPVAFITGYAYVLPNNYTALANSLVNVGPIAVSGAAEPWQTYESGVFSSDCGSDVDHAIQLVGYGTDDASGKGYWLIRNSWSASWGEDGYIRLERFGEGAEPCADDKTPGDGDGCKGGPTSMEVCGLCGIMSDSSYAVGAYLPN